MKIVIDLEDECIKKIEKVRFLIGGKEDIQLQIHVINAVANGTPLPKGHGRLIDASELLTVTDIREDCSEFTYVPYSEIEDAPTIIEADKESES